MIASKKKRLS